jgi:signal transduction histidine kinase
VQAALPSDAVWAVTAYRRFALRPSSEALLDVAIATVVLVGSLVQLSRGGLSGSPHEQGGLDWTGGLLVAFSAVPLLAWRRAPGAVLVSTASASVLLAALGYSLTVLLGPTVALFLFVQSRDEEHPWTRQSSGMVLALFSAYLIAAGFGGGAIPGAELLHTGLAWAVAWFAGERTRLRRAEVAELKARLVRADHDRERERRLAAAEERARIARDLHDAAGHAINVIAVRAGTARLREDPDRSQAALEAIEQLARKTAAEIDQIVGTLRERRSANGSVEVPPRLSSLETLVARHAVAGLGVSVVSGGEPRQLEGPIDQAAYRILQEGLTNAARHGTGTADVEFVFGDTALELTISNPVAGQSPARANGGHGLIGMRERATLLGGSLAVERADGAFRIRARLPYEGRRT